MVVGGRLKAKSPSAANRFLLLANLGLRAARRWPAQIKQTFPPALVLGPANCLFVVCLLHPMSALPIATIERREVHDNIIDLQAHCLSTNNATHVTMDHLSSRA
jgi:hypothetical protein